MEYVAYKYNLKSQEFLDTSYYSKKILKKTDGGWGLI